MINFSSNVSVSTLIRQETYIAIGDRAPYLISAQIYVYQPFILYEGYLRNHNERVNLHVLDSPQHSMRHVYMRLVYPAQPLSTHHIPAI